MSDQTIEALVLNPIPWGPERHAMFRVTLPAVGNLSFLQRLVGGYIEAVNLRHPAFPSNATMYVNEEGLLLGLEGNPLASAITHGYIVGPAVLLGPPDREGDDTTLARIDVWEDRLQRLILRVQADQN